MYVFPKKVTCSLTVHLCIGIFQEKMLWVLTNTLFMFCLQSKLSKLSQAPKLEPLNEGGGAVLLQVVSVQWNISSTVFTLLATYPDETSNRKIDISKLTRLFCILFPLIPMFYLVLCTLFWIKMEILPYKYRFLFQTKHTAMDKTLGQHFLFKGIQGHMQNIQ